MPPPLAYDDVVTLLRSAGCVFAEDEADLLVRAAHTSEELLAMVGQRSSGLPLEQVLGWAELAGVRLVVRPGVFVPRRRTELMAAEAVALSRVVSGRRPVVLDLCCGVGAVGAVVSRAVDVELYAADVDPAAVDCARTNLGQDAQVLLGDLFEPLPEGLRGRVDVLTANVPYVPTGEIGLLPAEARLHEPRATLDGGTDGLDVARRVAREAPGWLARRGSLLVETGEHQVQAAVGILEAVGLTARVVSSEALAATVVVGTRA